MSMFGRSGQDASRVAPRGDDGLTVVERTERAKRYMRAAAGPLSTVEQQALAERLARTNGDASRGRTGGGLRTSLA